MRVAVVILGVLASCYLFLRTRRLGIPFLAHLEGSAATESIDIDKALLVAYRSQLVSQAKLAFRLLALWSVATLFVLLVGFGHSVVDSGGPGLSALESLLGVADAMGLGYTYKVWSECNKRLDGIR